jgi:hypothetical protein
MESKTTQTRTVVVEDAQPWQDSHRFLLIMLAKENPLQLGYLNGTHPDIAFPRYEIYERPVMDVVVCNRVIFVPSFAQFAFAVWGVTEQSVKAVINHTQRFHKPIELS